MQPIRMVLLAACIGFFPALSARADFATPFIEINNKLGDVSEAQGWIVNFLDDTAPWYLIVVAGDTGQFYVLRAKAEPGIVPKELVGRSSIIKAEIVRPTTQGRQGQVKILGVRAEDSGPVQRNLPPATAPAR